MNTSLRIATWNVHCGVFERGAKADSTSIDYLSNCLRDLSADIVCLQEFELPEAAEYSLIEKLAKTAEYQYLEVFAPSKSHLIDGKMGLTILSKLPMTRSNQTQLFPNPKLSTLYDGKTINTHDKGALCVKVIWERMPINVICLHLFPFHLFGVKPSAPEFNPARKAFSDLLLMSRNQPTLICGDFNIADIDEFLPNARRENALTELIHTPTRPDGVRHDHILHSTHFCATTVRVIPSRSDHHLCVAELQNSELSNSHDDRTGIGKNPSKSNRNMQPVSILHLSDLHFGSGGEEQSDWKSPITFAKRERPCDTLFNFIDGDRLPCCPDFVVVSGDITIAGNADGWESYLKTMSPLIRSRRLPPADHFILVPGNHDIKRTSPSEPLPDEASRWRPFIDNLGDRHVRPWIPSVDRVYDELLTKALISMKPSNTHWGGIAKKTDKATGENNTIVFPFLYDRERSVFLYAFNSASISGSTTDLPKNVSEDLNVLRNYEGPYQEKIRSVLNEFDRHRQVDPCRIDPRELTLFEKVVEEVVERDGENFTGALKVAVLHHHVASIFPEEVKSYETLLNAGLFKRKLQNKGFQIILHGHKHWGEAFVDTAVSGGGAHLVISGGTIGGQPATGKSPGFYWIEWHPREGNISTRFIDVLGDNDQSKTFKNSKVTEFHFKPVDATGQLVISHSVCTPTRGIDLRSIFPIVEGRLINLLRKSPANTDGILSAGWAHRLVNKEMSTVATAYGLKILAITGVKLQSSREALPLIINTLIAWRKDDGGWAAKSQFDKGRPEATCWVINALYAHLPNSPILMDAARVLERMIEEDDGVTMSRTFSVSLVLRTLCQVLPNSPCISRLTNTLLTAAVRDGTGVPLYWGEKLDDFECPKASIIHTAHAILALSAVRKSGALVQNVHLANFTSEVACRWLLLQSCWNDHQEQIIRDPTESRYDQLIVSHFTTPWVIMALLQANCLGTEPRIQEEVRKLFDFHDRGLWNQESVTSFPVWATHDALIALREAALSGVYLTD